MYVKRVRITNYGPIEDLNIEFPFDDAGKPQPVVLVGANGSGKSVLLSHIVNGLLNIQAKAYPESSEVEPGKVYKLQATKYVTSGKDYSFTQIDFMNSLPIKELILTRRKKDFEQGTTPVGIAGTGAQSLYDALDPEDITRCNHDVSQRDASQLLQENCALYFPPNRFEDPAWLNSENLTATAQHMDLKHRQGHSDRKIINISPLRANQDWFFNIFCDVKIFERQEIPTTMPNFGRQPVIIVYSGSACRLCEAAVEILRATMCLKGELSLSIGRRQNRAISMTIDNKIHVPNIFQLSSGEMSLLNLFLSILRDYDLTGNEFTSTKEIRGIVIVDEIDLHLHVRHQYEVLPKLMAMFPKVQFIVTSHSPLLVLGLQNTLGEKGFGLYELPSGLPIPAEDFAEFGEAYRAFSQTRQHSEEIQTAVKDVQKSLIYVEGPTDVKYFKRAAELCGFQNLMEVAEIRPGGGDGKLNGIWKGIKKVKDQVQRKSVILLYDPEHNFCDTEGNMFRRSMVKCTSHSIQNGIENLFGRQTLKQVRQEHPEFINVSEEHYDTVDGERKIVPESQEVNKKTKNKSLQLALQERN